MGSFRFRKSIKIAPGSKINLSKSGISMTNKLAPGLSYRTQLAGGRKKTAAKGPIALRGWYILLAILLIVSFFTDGGTAGARVACAVIGIIMLCFTGLAAWRASRPPKS